MDSILKKKKNTVLLCHSIFDLIQFLREDWLLVNVRNNKINVYTLHIYIYLLFVKNYNLVYVFLIEQNIYKCVY